MADEKSLDTRVEEGIFAPVMFGKKIALPADWCKQNCVGAGGAVYVTYAKDGRLHIRPVESLTTQSGRKVIVAQYQNK